jgi:hypothetical protein
MLALVTWLNVRPGSHLLAYIWQIFALTKVIPILPLATWLNLRPSPNLISKVTLMFALVM